MIENVRLHVLRSDLRVNHAGERGAVSIYKGQLDVLKDTALAPMLKSMLSQEEEHLGEFDKILVEKNVRPSLLDPLWRLGGYGLGCVSAFLGPKAAMACTVAVEEVIVEHYQEQLVRMEDAQLCKTIEKFQNDELHHKNEALAHDAEAMPYYSLFRFVVKGITKTAITIAKRI